MPSWLFRQLTRILWSALSKAESRSKGITSENRLVSAASNKSLVTLTAVSQFKKKMSLFCFFLIKEFKDVETIHQKLLLKCQV